MSDKTVLIIGCAARKDQGALDEIELAISEYSPEVWTLNNCFLETIRSDRHFQLHGFQTMIEAHGYEYMHKLSTMDCPLVLFEKEANGWDEHYPELKRPKVIVYPKESALALVAGREYFDNSFPWMIAMAVLEGRTRLIMAGLDYGLAAEKRKDLIRTAEVIDSLFRNEGQVPLGFLEDFVRVVRSEESWAIPCIMYHLGIARGVGMETVIIGENHGLFHDRWGGLYGVAACAGGR